MSDQPDVAFLLVSLLLFLPVACRPQWVARQILAYQSRPGPPSKLGVEIMQGCAIFGLGCVLYRLAIIGINAAGLSNT